MDANEFKKLTGSEPIQDDLARVNCEHTGEVGHRQCGLCEHGRPRFLPCNACTKAREGAEMRNPCLDFTGPRTMCANDLCWKPAKDPELYCPRCAVHWQKPDDGGHAYARRLSRWRSWNGGVYELVGHCECGFHLRLVDAAGLKPSWEHLRVGSMRCISERSLGANWKEV